MKASLQMEPRRLYEQKQAEIQRFFESMVEEPLRKTFWQKAKELYPTFFDSLMKAKKVITDYNLDVLAHEEKVLAWREDTKRLIRMVLMHQQFRINFNKKNKNVVLPITEE